jgi:hypothetical protein
MKRTITASIAALVLAALPARAQVEQHSQLTIQATGLIEKGHQCRHIPARVDKVGRRTGRLFVPVHQLGRH